MREHITGYDARISEASVLAFWDAPRRATFLLREDVPAPLSVDPIVWPSVFDTGQGIGLPPEERVRLGFAGDGRQLDPPPWTGPHAPLWEDLAALQAHLRPSAEGRASWTLIAVTLCSELDPSVPGAEQVLEEGWQRLGYDVADGSLISGLSNCGYSEQEVGVLGAAWSPHLNAYHLFDDPDLDFEFRALTDRRVPEHAPFYVYGLYRYDAQRREGLP